MFIFNHVITLHHLQLNHSLDTRLFLENNEVYKEIL